MPELFVRCPCNHCDGKIEFERSQAGNTITCPHCELDTILHVPASTNKGGLRGMKSIHVLAGKIVALAVVCLCFVLKMITFDGIFLQEPDLFSKGALMAINLVLWIAGFCIYFYPSLVAKDKKNAQAILVLNFFLGWTFIGWVAALVWANTKDN
jgi:hypothetical protein